MHSGTWLKQMTLSPQRGVAVLLQRALGSESGGDKAVRALRGPRDCQERRPGSMEGLGLRV